MSIVFMLLNFFKVFIELFIELYRIISLVVFINNKLYFLPSLINLILLDKHIYVNLVVHSIKIKS